MEYFILIITFILKNHEKLKIFLNFQ